MSVVPIALIAQLRKEIPVSLMRAKEALLANDGNVKKSILWLRRDALANGSAKASKVSGKVAAEGLVVLTMDPMHRKASLIEVNCETDFVSRSPLFADLCHRLGNSHLFYEQMDQNAPLLPSAGAMLSMDDKVISCTDGILSRIGELGEKIQMGKIAFERVSRSKGIIGGYIHRYSGTNHPPSLGRIGGIVTLNYESTHCLDSDQSAILTGLSNKIAQHIVGFNPKDITPSPDSDPSQSLLTQDFLMGGGSVENVLAQESKRLKIDNLFLSNFYRIEVGQGIVKEASNFVEEVQQQARLGSNS